MGTIIAVGESVSEKEYQGRAFISTSGKGSTLTIGAAKDTDAGKYKCSVALKEDNRPEVIHTVTIKDFDSAPRNILPAPQKTLVEKQKSGPPAVKVESDTKDGNPSAQQEVAEASPTPSAKTSASISSAPSVILIFSG